MDDIDRKTLKTSVQFFRSNLYDKDPRLVEDCENASIITSIMAEEVRALNGSNKVTKLFEILPYGGPDALDKFIDVLKTNQPIWLANELIKTREKIRKEDRLRKKVHTRDSVIKKSVDHLINSHFTLTKLAVKQQIRDKLVDIIKDVLFNELQEFISSNYHKDISDIHTTIAPYLTDSENDVNETKAFFHDLKQAIDSFLKSKRMIKSESKSTQTEVDTLRLKSKQEVVEEENRKLNEKVRMLETEIRRLRKENIQQGTINQGPEAKLNDSNVQEKKPNPQFERKSKFSPASYKFVQKRKTDVKLTIFKK